MYRTLIMATAVLTAALGTHALAQSCPKTVLPNSNATSGNARCPMLRYRFERSVYLITQAELAAAGYTAGSMPTTIGWNYQVGNTLTDSAPLIVYMENTTDTTNTKSTTWTTAITGMTVVHNATTTLPAAAGPFDIALTGGSPFTYTGGGLYIAFDFGQYTGTLATGTVAWCNNTLVGGLLGNQSNTAAPTTLTASAFRPETRLDGAPGLANDVAVNYIYSSAELPYCKVQSQIVRATITNNSFNTLTNIPVTLNISGVESFTDVQMVASVAPCGGQSIVTFAPYSPSAFGNNTVTVSVPNDDVPGNNALSRPMNNTQVDWGYKYPGSTASGGVGFTNGSGAFVARYTSNVADAISAVKLEFFGASATTYRVAIYGDNAGMPSTTALYVDAADRTVTAAGPVTITLPSPVAVGPGNFYVGLQQTNTTNANYSFDTENPVRAGTFFFSGALPPAAWTDFSPGTNFKLNIGIVLETGCPANGACCTAGSCSVATEAACLGGGGTYQGDAVACADVSCGTPCPADINGDNTVNVSDLLAVINGWGACPAPCPPYCPADVNDDCAVNVTDLLAVINAWGPCAP